MHIYPLCFGFLSHLRLSLWLSSKESTSNAGDVSLIPGQRARIPHAMGQLSPCAKTTEPMYSEAHVPQLQRSLSTAAEAATHHNEDITQPNNLF